MFFPGETITHNFVIPFSVNEVQEVTLSYKQNESIMFEKTITSGFVALSTQATRVTHVFTQAETLLFQDNTDFTIQINVYTKGGTRHASHEVKSSSGIQYLRELQPLERSGG